MRLAPVLLLAACSTAPSSTATFSPDSPAIYVAKVKNVLVGLPPTDSEVQAVTANPSSLARLVDGWMKLSEYEQKMRVFFELAFQQTQLTLADFTDMIPPQGLGVGGQMNLLLQNLRESFARTVLDLVDAGHPLSDAFTTRELMMTPALMELYAFLDSRHVDDQGKVQDLFAESHPTLQIFLTASPGPIPITETLDPTSASYMHFYNAEIGNISGYPDPSCNVDPVVFSADAYALHQLLYGGVFQHKSPTKVFCQTRSTTGYQMLPSDFTTWKRVTVRAPKSGEPTTTFYDLPSLRAANELVLSTPRLGFFSTPAFGANWPTNQSNQMRVTLNQTLIVATGLAIDGTDATAPATTPGLDSDHAAPGSSCFGCHQLLDPTRSILASTWSWYYYPQSDAMLVAEKGLFAFQGVITPVGSIDDFANTLATHPAVPAGWVQKLCYYVNSSPCDANDPEFQRLVSLFKSSKLSWNTLVRELVTSPITTHTALTLSTQTQGEVVAVSRRDHLCAALSSRLGLGDACGLDPSQKPLSSAVGQIVGGLPSDGYGRGATAPVLPNQPTLFYRAGVENICAALAPLVIDAPPNAKLPNAKNWSSAQPDAAIADFVSQVMALTSSDARAANATTILKTHFSDAQKSGASASDALKSTFVAACLAPTSIGIGM